VVPLTEPLTDFPLPASGGSSAVVIQFPLAGTPDDHPATPGNDTDPGFCPSRPAEGEVSR
jgi:hypothetical protein